MTLLTIQIAIFLKQLLDHDKAFSLLSYLRSMAEMYINVMNLVDGFQDYEVYEINWDNMLDQLFADYRNEYEL
jgi:hypothetical protein